MPNPLKTYIAKRKLEKHRQNNLKNVKEPSQSHIKGWQTRKASKVPYARLMNDPIVRAVMQSGKRSGIWQGQKLSIRKALFMEGKTTCCFCRKPLQITSHKFDNYATIEHITPTAFGGSNEMHNLDLACEPCNQAGSAQINADLRYIRSKIDRLIKPLVGA